MIPLNRILIFLFFSRVFFLKMMASIGSSQFANGRKIYSTKNDTSHLLRMLSNNVYCVLTTYRAITYKSKMFYKLGDDWFLTLQVTRTVIWLKWKLSDRRHRHSHKARISYTVFKTDLLSSWNRVDNHFVTLGRWSAPGEKRMIQTQFFRGNNHLNLSIFPP